MTVWLIILFLLGSFVYLNQVGLPGFVKKPLLQKLRAQGLELQFSRLRLRLYHGIVAENVRFGLADDPLSPKLTASEVQVLLSHRALARLQLQVDGLELRQGRLVWPIVETNRPLRQLLLDNIQTELRLLPGDRWALDNFKATFAGGTIRLSGNVTNASAVRDWKLFQPSQTGPQGSVHKRLSRLADELQRIRFDAPPELVLNVQGDARDPQSFLLRLRLTAPGSQTPWGTFSQGSFTARLLPATTNGLSQAELHLDAVEAQTTWATSTNLHLTIHLVSVPNYTNLIKGDLGLIAQTINSKWASVTNARFTAQWIHAFTNPIPLSGEGQLVCDEAQSQWGSARKVNFTARLTDPNASGEPFNPVELPALTSWWTNLESHLLDWECQLSDLQTAKLHLEKIDLTGSWRAPWLTLIIPEAKLAQGKLAGKASVNVTTRALDAKLASDVDPRQFYPLLTEGGRQWLSQFSWQEPPEIAADISLLLPQWTNTAPNWRAEVLPSLKLDGQFKVKHGGAFRDLPVSTADSHFLYSNRCWNLPDLTLTRPEGRVELSHTANDVTKDYYWKILSTIDVRCIRAMLETNQQRALDYVQFTEPPRIQGEVWGRWRDYDRTGFKAHVILSNFAYRGQAASAFQSDLQYTNRFLLLSSPRAWIGSKLLSAESMNLDFTAKKIYLTNGFSTADPRMVTRAIGPNVDRKIEPYQFLEPPTARVRGVIPMKDEEDADLHFDIEGGPFKWQQFNLPRVDAHVYWKGSRLTLSDVHAAFYGGQARGSAAFDFRPTQGTAFSFDLFTTNTQFNSLIADLANRTNKLEGELGGRLIINSANSADLSSWQGGGELSLKDGLIWDIPVFGVFSPVLNSLAPGLGNSRASAATGTFVISNGVVHSEDLQIRSSGTRLQYRGMVNFEGQVNARVEAELLRDMWVVGPIISTVFGPVAKLFEYKVSGTLAQPKTEPVFFVPKIVLMPFHPLRTLRELFPPQYNTNAPPVPQLQQIP